MLTVGDSTVETPTKYNNNTAVHPKLHERLGRGHAEWEKSNKMRLEALLKQRPLDPSVYCCDYRAAEAAATLGIEGLREWDGGHLCNECLGVEYLEDRDESLPPWHDEEETNCGVKAETYTPCPNGVGAAGDVTGPSVGRLVRFDYLYTSMVHHKSITINEH
ncbi:hypothetical protein LTR16_000915 [Cryomyces antarcticus]|uniref:Uncharacterized protein n=1 Tax=Cryomyces antarcticus TaxID=329879 RepID=A0ABR0KUA1_9PEZI|nr:hypothetical protein LTR39_000620 [Cryomyces antarcticus]KAK5020540.1 hypothetical protein LTR60_000424 [Cryomyces antarcticus]KAK5131250.1 hypothetical protein LTR16_000915 [Cryomyces antarcticus]